MVIDDLRQDHINISRVLDVLEQQLARLESGERPDYYLMTKSAEYIQEYPDIFHHPREDAMFAVYLEDHKEGREQIEALQKEHEELRALTVSLRETVECLFHGGVVGRDEVLDQITHFIDRQREHIGKEESEVFPMIKAALTAEQWGRIDAMVPVVADPVFGPNLKSQYESLYRRIFD
jgi:hemerythrin-like domain-containing protein